MAKSRSPLKRVRKAFDREALARICTMHETEFAEAYDMTVTVTPPSKWSWGESDYDDFYAFLDRGSDVLAVAHLDTVVTHAQRVADYAETADGPVIHSGALDDRLGAYTILELLPKLGINVDVLLTTGEESGCSTAEHFEPEKEYNWVIEFDRGGMDVVMYQYEDHDTRLLVQQSGAKVGQGSFSDVAYLEHLGVKGFNWGVAYHDYHGPRGYAYLEDYWEMVTRFMAFHSVNKDTELPHYAPRYESKYDNPFEPQEIGGRVEQCEVCERYSVNEDAVCEDCGTCQFCWWDEKECECNGSAAARAEKEAEDQAKEVESLWA